MNAKITFDRIETAYRRLGYDLNWGFLTCPRDKFLDPRVLLVGLNPGGGRGDAALEHRSGETEVRPSSMTAHSSEARTSSS